MSDLIDISSDLPQICAREVRRPKIHVKMEEIVPLVQMLSGWLVALKEKEHDINFDDKM